MITVKAVPDSNGGLGAETKPDTKHGSHFDGVNFYFFESDEERETFLSNLNKPE